jgi:hypothetical protein
VHRVQESGHKQSIYDGAVAITGTPDPRRRVANELLSRPSTKLKTTSEETDLQAVELDKQLQEYLKSYFSRNGQNEIAVAVGQDFGPPDYTVEPPDDLPNDIDDTIPF